MTAAAVDRRLIVAVNVAFVYRPICSIYKPPSSVWAAREDRVDILPFSPHLGSPGTRFELREGRQKCALRVRRAVEARRKGSNDGVEKSAHDPS